METLAANVNGMSTVLHPRWCGEPVFVLSRESRFESSQGKKPCVRWPVLVGPSRLHDSLRLTLSLSSFITPTETRLPLDSILRALIILGYQTATFATSGMAARAVAENRRLWQTQPMATSFISRRVFFISCFKEPGVNSTCLRDFRCRKTVPPWPAQADLPILGALRWRQLFRPSCYITLSSALMCLLFFRPVRQFILVSILFSSYIQYPNELVSFQHNQS